MTLKEKWDRIQQLNARIAELNAEWRRAMQEKQKILCAPTEADRVEGESAGVPLVEPNWFEGTI